MPVINCLEAAKKAYKDIIEESEIESVFDQLEKNKNRALNAGIDLFEELNRFAENNIRDRERLNASEELQQLRNTQAVIDNLQRVELFKDKGFKDPIVKALKAKIQGSPYKISRGRENTESKILRAGTTFERQFLQDINNELLPIWVSKQYQLDIADALISLSRGEKPTDTSFGRIAQIVKKYQEKLNNGRRELGIDIHELEDRITPNLHYQEKILKLTSEERRMIKRNGQKEYDYLFNRWRDFIYPLLDKDRTFSVRNINPDDLGAVGDFLKSAFDNIVNKGKITQDKMNFANRIKQPRVLHWKDGQSLITYNDQFGSGAIQDSITRELSYGFRSLELMKDWGLSPQTTLERTFRILDEDPNYKDRLNKADELSSLSKTLRGLTRNDADYTGFTDQIFRYVKAWEAITKLGKTTLRSIPDLGLLADEASKLGIPAYQAIPEALQKFTFGLSQDEKIAFADLFDVGKKAQLGAIANYYENGFNANSIPGLAVRLMFKLNLLDRWDKSLKAQITSVVSRYFAQNKHFTWEMLSETDKNSFDLYNIKKPDWDLIRQSSIRLVGNKEFITPDAIQEVQKEIVEEILKSSGVKKITDSRIQLFKDEVENKLRDYFQDRQDHVILRPDLGDRNFISFGLEPQNAIGRGVLQLFSQFKLYGVAYIRKPIFEKLYGKGARDFNEALFQGKADFPGLAKLTTYGMALSYASLSFTNLLEGLSPPSLSSKKTWMDMMQDALGFYGLAIRLDPNDLLASSARALAGPAISDLSKLINLGSHAIGDLITGEGFDATNRALYGFTKNNLPLLKQAYTIWFLNFLLFNEWQDMASPGKRQKYLQQLEQDQGVTQLF